MRAWMPTYIIQFFKLDIYDLVVLKDILKIVSANQNHEIYIYEFPSSFSLSYLKYISSVISLRNIGSDLTTNFKAQIFNVG